MHNRHETAEFHTNAAPLPAGAAPPQPMGVNADRIMYKARTC
jgi:hypothetical protein